MPSLEELFDRGTGGRCSKWRHYFEIYDRYLTPFRGKACTYLEIGVSQGGSLEIFQEYLGSEAKIIGLDIKPECLQWARNGRNPGSLLAGELGWTPVYLHLNTGLHVSTNGRALADLLERLAAEWPVPLRELAIIGHSYGGLVARSAHYYAAAAGHTWPRSLGRLIFLGTPHHGSALERAGNYVTLLLDSTPYSSPFARISRIRSSGITDLRYGNLIDADWEGAGRFQHTGDRRQVLPLPEGVRCFAIAAEKGHKSCKVVSGDGLVSVDSALGRHADPARTLSFPPSHQWVAHGMTHFDLLRRAAVYRKLREWLTS